MVIIAVGILICRRKVKTTDEANVYESIHEMVVKDDDPYTQIVQTSKKL